MLSPREADILLSELCRDLGLCLPAHARHSVSDHATDSPDAFARAVLEAGEVNPAADPSLYRDVYQMVSAAFDRARADAPE